MTLSTFSLLTSHHHPPVSRTFQTETLSLLSTRSPLSPCPVPRNRLSTSVSLDLPLLGISSTRNHTIFVLLLSGLFHGAPRFQVSCTLWQVPAPSSLLGLNNIPCVDGPHCSRAPSPRRPRPLSAAGNGAVWSTRVQTSLHSCSQFFQVNT